MKSDFNGPNIFHSYYEYLVFGFVLQNVKHHSYIATTAIMLDAVLCAESGIDEGRKRPEAM
jgi:hypothetical protein